MKPKNTTAPPRAQVSDSEPIGFSWVMLKQSETTLQALPLFSNALALELAVKLAPEFPDRELYVHESHLPDELLEYVKRTASRHADIVVSCRSAERPGQAYMTRLGAISIYNARLDLSDESPCVGGAQA
ncbi:hypothetical protein [Pseudomonas sp. DWP3-1-2]|uniref:hypothetical protein n=1 Tax=Pseudomonas sp. DWP3-1-2 TaxID=2804645 RepID=UPI003CEB4181